MPYSLSVPTLLVSHLGATVDLKEPTKNSSYDHSFTGTVNGVKPNGRGGHCLTVLDSENNAFDVDYGEVEHFYKDGYDQADLSKSPDIENSTRHFMVTTTELSGGTRSERKLLATLCGNPSRDDWKVLSEIMMGSQSDVEVSINDGMIYFDGGTSGMSTDVRKDRILSSEFETLKKHMDVVVDEREPNTHKELTSDGFDYCTYVQSTDKLAFSVVANALTRLKSHLNMKITPKICDDAIDIYNEVIEPTMSEVEINTRRDTLATAVAKKHLGDSSQNLAAAHMDIGLRIRTSVQHPLTDEPIEGEIIDVRERYDQPIYVVETDSGEKHEVGTCGAERTDGLHLGTDPSDSILAPTM